MTDEQRTTILDLCRRYSCEPLTKFIKEYETDTLVDMIINSGDGEELLAWFNDIYPEYFKPYISDEECAYWNEMDLRYDEQRERALIEG